MDEKTPSLGPVTEGAIGAGVGAVIGVALAFANLISPPAILGVAAGLGLGSGFNAWRRRRRDRSERL